MVRRFVSMFTLLLGSAAAAQTPASAPVNARAIELFESDWVLMDWGLRFHDKDHDANLSAAEADAGARAFRVIADGDHDGRVTPQEFARAREILLTRY